MLSLPLKVKFGLWLNLTRIRNQRAFVTASGISAAMSDQEIDPSFFDSIAENEGEAEALERATNRARVRARYGNG